MSDKIIFKNIDEKSVNLRKEKRKVISPISDNVHAVVASAISTGKSTNCSNESEHSVKKVRPEPYSPDYTGVYTFNMAYSPSPYGLPSVPGYGISPPHGPSFGIGVQPPWATEILQEVKDIKTRLKSIEKIKKTVNSISVKISDLEIKVSDSDKRLTHTENAAAFMESRYEEHNTVLIQAKQQVKSLNRPKQTKVIERKLNFFF